MQSVLLPWLRQGRQPSLKPDSQAIKSGSVSAADDVQVVFTPALIHSDGYSSVSKDRANEHDESEADIDQPGIHVASDTSADSDVQAIRYSPPPGNSTTQTL
jgi:hypothetical protein